MALIRIAWSLLLDTMLGSTCAGCGARGRGAACTSCRAAATRQSCIVGTTFLDQCPVSQLVRAAKFGRWRGGGSWFAEQLVERLDPDVRRRVVAVAWVPRSAARARSRGVDLPRDVARRAAARMQVPLVDVLVRRPRSRRQRGLDRDERRANARASFDLHDDANGRLGRLPPSIAQLSDPIVLLVDDVCATGSTINACAALITVACRRRFRDIHVHPIAIASVPARASPRIGVTNSRSLRRKCIHENR